MHQAKHTIIHLVMRRSPRTKMEGRETKKQRREGHAFFFKPILVLRLLLTNDLMAFFYDPNRKFMAKA